MGLTVEVPHSVECLGVVCVIGWSRCRARPVRSAGVDLGAVEFARTVALLQPEEAGGEWLAAFALPRSRGCRCRRSSDDSLAEIGGVVGAGCDVVGEGIAGRLRGTGGW